MTFIWRWHEWHSILWNDEGVQQGLFRIGQVAYRTIMRNRLVIIYRPYGG